MTDELRYSASTIFSPHTPTDPNIPFAPERIKVSSAKVSIGGSSWLECVQPVGSHDRYVYASPHKPGFSLYDYENGQSIQITGVISERTNILSSSKQRIAQVTKGGCLYLYESSQDDYTSVRNILKFHLKVPKYATF